MAATNTKANDLIDLINENTEFQITKEQFATGVFPWSKTSDSKFNSKLVSGSYGGH